MSRAKTFVMSSTNENSLTAQKHGCEPQVKKAVSIKPHNDIDDLGNILTVNLIRYFDT